MKTVVLATLAASSVLSAPIPLRIALIARGKAVVARQSACAPFALQDYNSFQISDGTGGTAEQEANAVFADAFSGCDLSTVDSTSLDNLDTMAKAAVDAEETFNSAIEAGGDAADALEVGKIKNKVLKLAGEVQVLLIQQAQGEDVADKLAEEQGKLQENLSNDAENAGAASQSIQFGGSTSTDASTDSSSAATSSTDTSSDDASAGDTSTDDASSDDTSSSDDVSDSSTDTSTTSTTDSSTSAATGSGACPAFALQDYNSFQISDGTGGTAEQEANAVFADAFSGCDLSTVDSTSLDNLNTMAKAAVDAEETFNSAIEAGGDAADALEVGKIKNKVLKLAGEVQALLIQQAQGEDVADKLAEEQGKLQENLTNDAGQAGEPSQSIQFDG